MPICLGKCQQGSSFCFFLCCDLVFQRPVGIRLGTADTVSPRKKSCEAQPDLFMSNFTVSLSYSHSELLIVCCNCLTPRVGNLEGAD